MVHKHKTRLDTFYENDPSLGFIFGCRRQHTNDLIFCGFVGITWRQNKEKQTFGLRIMDNLIKN